MQRATQRGWAAFLILAAVAALPGAAQDGQTSGEGKDRVAPAVQEGSVKPTGTPAAAGQNAGKKLPLTIDGLKSPPGSVLVLFEEARDLLKLLPKMVVLTPEKYQELLDQLEQLRRQARPERPLVPSVCRLSGRLDGEVARLKAAFEFKTERPRTAVTLGCRRGWAVAATYGDGQLPVFQPVGDEGYILLVEKPGTYQVTLELAAPLLVRGNDRAFDLDLPRCPITLLEQLDLPAGAAEARIGGRVFRTKPAEMLQLARIENQALGPIERLDVVWKGATPAPKQVPVTRTARAKLVARVEDGQVQIDAELTLQVLSGAVGQWRIQAPLAFALESPQILPGTGPGTADKIGIQDERVERVVVPTEADPTLTIHLKEPSAEPLRVVFQARLPRKGATVPLGPFAVYDVLPQNGTVEVRGRPDVRFRPVLRGDVVQREITDEQRNQGTLAAFHFWDLPSARTAAVVAPAVALEFDTLKGNVEARASHTLQMLPVEGDATPWRIKTQLEFTPVRTSVDRLELELPAGYSLEDQVGVLPTDVVENPVEVKPGPGKRQTVTIRLARRQTRPWTLELSGLVTSPGGKQEEAFELPKLTQAFGGLRGEALALLDRGGRVQVALLPGRELAARSLPPEATVQRSHEIATWLTERWPARVDVAWLVRKAEVPARVTAEIVVAGRRARVRARLDFAAVPRQVRLRVPAGLAGPVRLADGSELRPEASAPAEGGWVAELGPLRAESLVLTYTVALPAPVSEACIVPLIQPDGGTETRLLLWTDPDVRPVLSEGAWEDLPLEPGTDPDRLPDLVLRGGAEDRVALRLRKVSGTPQLTAAVERVLTRVAVTDAGTHVYRVRFLVSKLHARQLDVEMPVPLSRHGLGVRLDGREVRRWLVDESGREAEVSRLVRLEVEPELYRKPVVLDLAYTLGTGRAEGNTSWQAQLRPPQLAGAVLLGRVRWGVELPSGWLAVHVGGAGVEQRWAFWGGLPTPRPAATAEELESWFAQSEAAAAAVESEPSLVCAQSGLGTVRVLHVPQQAWLLACSLTFLAVGLILSFMPLPRPLFWGVVAVLGILLAAVSVLWPGTFPVLIYGCQPAALILLLVVGVQWMLHQRYRRRLIFMPGFTRVKGGSSLIQPAVIAGREPSTVDQQPPRRGSSFAADQGS